MTQAQILEELKKLTPAERLVVIEAALGLIREDLQRVELPRVQARKQELAAAAQALLSDYTSDSELTSFKVLDGEDFHA
jgi:hypothetical protein